MKSRQNALTSWQTKMQPMKTTKKITINSVRLQWCCEAIDVDIDRLS